MHTTFESIRFVIIAMTMNLSIVGMFVYSNMPTKSFVYAEPATYSSNTESTIAPAKNEIISATPERIVIPSVDIDLSVEIGSFDPNTDTWNVEDGKAFYADTSVPVNNNNGVTLIYGHARESAFMSLGDMPKNAEVRVYADGNVFIYRLTSKRDVVPSDTSVFEESGPPTLVLQTCTGPFDSHRSLYSFDLKSIDSE